MEEGANGKIVTIISFEQYVDQIIEHSRLVTRAFGLRDQHYDFLETSYPGSIKEVLTALEHMAIEIGEERPSLEEVSRVWIDHKFAHKHAIESLNLWRDRGAIVFVRNYVPVRAIELALECGLEGPAVLSWAQEFCVKCYERGAPEIDKGIIIYDERLEGSYHNRKDDFASLSKYAWNNARSHPLLALVKDDPRWTIVRAGIDELPMENGIAVWPEAGSLWRDYYDVEIDVIRQILDLPESGLDQERLFEALNGAKFQKADQT